MRPKAGFVLGTEHFLSFFFFFWLVVFVLFCFLFLFFVLNFISLLFN